MRAPRRAAFMASIVSALGTRGSEGKALSLAIRIIIKAKASDPARPMLARTAAASSLTRPSIRARTARVHLLGLQCSTKTGDFRTEACMFSVTANAQWRSRSVAALWPMGRFPLRLWRLSEDPAFDSIDRRGAQGARQLPAPTQNGPGSSKKVPCSSKPVSLVFGPEQRLGHPPRSTSALRRGAGGARSAPGGSPGRNRPVESVGGGQVLCYICSHVAKVPNDSSPLCSRALPARLRVKSHRRSESLAICCNQLKRLKTAMG